MEGKNVIESSEFIEKLKAAKMASENYDAVIIARTDSRAVHGLDEAIKRGHQYLETGADILFIEAPETVEELKQIAEEFRGAMLLANMVEGGKTPILSQEELESLGFKLIIYGLMGLFSSIKALNICYNYLKLNKTSIGFDGIIDFKQFEELIDLEKYKELEAKFSG